MTNEYKPLGASDNSPDWFYREWAANAPNNQLHGHMCDGLVIGFVEVKAVLTKVFPMVWLTVQISGWFQKMALVWPMRRCF